jgi:hypothetical protein
MATLAMGLFGLDRGRTNATQDIDPVWNSFEMSGVHAVMHSTQVVDLVFVGDRAVREDVTESMGLVHPTTGREVPVSREFVNASSPEPAGWRLLYTWPEITVSVEASGITRAAIGAPRSSLGRLALKGRAALFTDKVYGHRGYLRGVRPAAAPTARRPLFYRVLDDAALSALEARQGARV